jgi:hypothetical protein
MLDTRPQEADRTVRFEIRLPYLTEIAIARASRGTRRSLRCLPNPS